MANKRHSDLPLVTIPTAGAVIATDVAGGASESILVSDLLASTPPPVTEQAPSGNFLKSGGTFAHDDDLDIAVGEAEYYIQGLPYESPAAIVTAAAADATYPRIDAIVLNSSGVAAIVTGTPAASPVRPEIDPSTQLELTFITVAALATEPEVNVEPIYLEGTEWTDTPSGARVIHDDLTGPRTGTKAIKFNAAIAGDYAKFVDSGAFALEDFQLLAFWIDPVTFVNQKSLSIQAFLAGVPKGVVVSLRNGLYGLNTSNTAFHLVVIPTNAFGVAGITIDELRLTVAGGSTALTCFVDDITLQGGISQVVISDRLRDRGVYDADLFYNRNDLVNDGVNVYKAIQPGKGHTPSAVSSAYWRVFARFSGGMPQVSFSADRTVLASEDGVHFYHPAADGNARTITIDSNANLALPIGFTATIINHSASDVTLAITTDTLVLAGDGATGSITIAQYGVITFTKVLATTWFANGTNVTS
jgi:hypothetical protein